MRTLEASTSLLVDQWQGADRLKGLVDALLEPARENLKAADEFERMRTLGAASGVWLDMIGERMGLPRPSVGDTSSTFGFDDAGVGFDSGRMDDGVSPDPRSPIGDELYRRLARARGWALLGFGTYSYMHMAMKEIDPSAVLVDLDDMSARITTSRVKDMRLADSTGALPRPAGVRLEIRDSALFGFDDAGVPFDTGRML